MFAQKKKPGYTDKKTVNAQEYNELVDFYTRALEDKDKIILKLRRDNEVLMRSMVRNSERLAEIESRKK